MPVRIPVATAPRVRAQVVSGTSASAAGRSVAEIGPIGGQGRYGRVERGVVVPRGSTRCKTRDGCGEPAATAARRAKHARTAIVVRHVDTIVAGAGRGRCRIRRLVPDMPNMHCRRAGITSADRQPEAREGQPRHHQGEQDRQRLVRLAMHSGNLAPEMTERQVSPAPLPQVPVGFVPMHGIS